MGVPRVSPKVIWDRWTWQLPSQALGLWLSGKAKVQGKTEQPEYMASLLDSTEPGLMQGILGQSLYTLGVMPYSVPPREPQGSSVDQLWNWLCQGNL